MTRYIYRGQIDSLGITVDGTDCDGVYHALRAACLQNMDTGCPILIRTPLRSTDNMFAEDDPRFKAEGHKEEKDA